jgi:succinate dehydrogenase flavin-adding protein (antitoxin of CptAB toxin-antitoxin module)
MEEKILKKRILYKAAYRGTRENDLIIRNFVQNNIDFFEKRGKLQELDDFLELSDQIIFEILRKKNCKIYQKYKEIFDKLGD